MELAPCFVVAVVLRDVVNIISVLRLVWMQVLRDARAEQFNLGRK